jgi:two-component system, sensor histidine kinase and response regulator
MTKILVIDDEAILRTEIVEWLTLEGYEAASASDGMEGINQAFHYLPDLIVCDITMPMLDGYGVLLELRSNPATGYIPFIFVTARAAYEDVRQGMDLGADDYITKPFTRLELLQAIQTRLAKKSVQEQHHQQQVEQWQQAFEQEREQRLLKSKLVAMFSHDFRNPLASIMSSNTLLRDYADRMDEERRLTLFNRVEASVHQLLQMLDDMLIVAQMETGNLDFNPESLNIETFLQHIVEEFQTIYGETHSLVYESQLNDMVMADPRLLRQVATNLLTNAIKYSPLGSEVEVLLERQNGQVMLTVRDHGIGVPVADQPHMFMAFQRASNVGEVRGTGLGLAIVKQAVDLHGGSIHVESEVGSGTTVKVGIPTQ